MIKLSVIIVSWNVKKLLEQCLKSIFETLGSLETEIIVIDNNSSDGSVEMVKEKFPSVVLIENKRNSGYGTANNQGIRISKGKYILILNPDTIIFPDTLNELITFLDQNPKIGAVGPKILNSDGSVQFECARNFPTLLTEFFALTTLDKRFPKSRFFGKTLMSYWDHNDRREVNVISGACALIRKSVFNEAGLFDEDFFMYVEETDLFYRIKKNGWEVYFLPSAKIVHLWGKSAEQAGYLMAVEARRSVELFFRKHYGLGVTIAHRAIVTFVTFFIQIYGFLMYIVSRKKENKLKAEKIFLGYNAMFKWALGMK